MRASFFILNSCIAPMLILAVLHESTYCAVYIMNEEELLVQICGLPKESKKFMGERILWFFIFSWFCC